MEKERSVISGLGSSYELWEEVVDIACYLDNQSPWSTLDDKTPHEVWTSKKPSLKHLKVFVYEAYVYVPN